MPILAYWPAFIAGRRHHWHRPLAWLQRSDGDPVQSSVVISAGCSQVRYDCAGSISCALWMWPRKITRHDAYNRRKRRALRSNDRFRLCERANTHDNICCHAAEYVLKRPRLAVPALRSFYLALTLLEAHLPPASRRPWHSRRPFRPENANANPDCQKAPDRS